MKVIIAGSRTITDYSMVSAAIGCSLSKITEVVCGMARGVDLLGKQWAEERNIPVKEFPADWETLGRSAGFARNAQMGDYAEALIAITNGSNGARHMIEYARSKGLKIFIYSVI